MASSPRRLGRSYACLEHAADVRRTGLSTTAQSGAGQLDVLSDLVGPPRADRGMPSTDVSSHATSASPSSSAPKLGRGLIDPAMPTGAGASRGCVDLRAQVTSVPDAGCESSGVPPTRRTEAASRSATPPASEREIPESSPQAPGARERSSPARAIRAPRPRRSSLRRDTPRRPPRAAVAASPCESQLHRIPDTVQHGSWSGPAVRVDDAVGRSRARGSPRVAEPSARHRPRPEIAFEARGTDRQGGTARRDRRRPGDPS